MDLSSGRWKARASLEAASAGPRKAMDRNTTWSQSNRSTCVISKQPSWSEKTLGDYPFQSTSERNQKEMEMKKSIQFVFFAFVVLSALLSGCAPAATPTAIITLTPTQTLT